MSMASVSLIGVKIKVNSGNSELQGRVYAILPEEDLLMLFNEGPNRQKTYTIAKLDKLTSLVIMDGEPEQPLDLVIPAVNIEKLLDDFETSDTEEDGSRIFAEIGKTYNVEWVEDEIYMVDLDIRISPPYQSSSDIHGGNQSGVNRIWGVLEGVRNRLGLSPFEL